MAYSDFEQSAQHAAVEAVERRWKQRHDAEMRLIWKKRLNTCLAVLVLLSGLCVGGYFAVQQYGDEIRNLIGFDVRDVAKILPVDGLGFGADGECRESYVALIESFQDKECVLWRDAPSSVKPKSAQKGTRYLALVGDRGAARLFDLAVNEGGVLSGKELSPVGRPVEVDMAKFNEAVAHKTYFIRCNGIVYVCGCKDLAQGKSQLRDLLAF